MFEVDKENSVIYFYDVVGGDWMGGVTDSDFKKSLDEMEGRDVQIHVNSPGGDVWAGLAIHNFIESYPGKTTVVVDALAASAASYFPMAADEILMHENSLMMIHAPMTLAFGNSEEMMRTADVLDKHAAAMSKAYEKRSGKTAQEIDEIFNAEVWYTAEEAVQAGFADRVLTKQTTATASINNKIFNFKHLPKSMDGQEMKLCAAVLEDKRRYQLAAKVRIKSMIK